MSHLLLISNQPKAMEKNIFLDFDYAYFSWMKRDFSYFITYIDLRSLRPRKPLPSISLILFPWRNLLKVTERMIDEEHNRLSSKPYWLQFSWLSRAPDFQLGEKLESLWVDHFIPLTFECFSLSSLFFLKNNVIVWKLKRKTPQYLQNL